MNKDAKVFFAIAVAASVLIVAFTAFVIWKNAQIIKTLGPSEKNWVLIMMAAYLVTTVNLFRISWRGILGRKP